MYILVVYLSPTIRFKYRSAQAAKRGETIKRYESFVTKASNNNTKASTYGDVESDKSSASQHSLLDGDFVGEFADDDMDTSLLLDMGE